MKNLQASPVPGSCARIIRHRSGSVNLSATLAEMAAGDAILVRLAADSDKGKIIAAARNVRVRVKVEHRPLASRFTSSTFLVTSRGLSRSRAQRAKGAKSAGAEPTGLKGTGVPVSPAERTGRCFREWRKIGRPEPPIDIFS